MDSKVREMTADPCSISLNTHIYHSLRTAIIKDCSLEVHSCITRVSMNQVCHDVMFAACRVSTHLTLPQFSATLSVSAVMDVS